MTNMQALFFGFLQGVTEFLPVSSSGHLAVTKHLFSLQEVPLLFDVILHVATLLVVLIVFRRRVGKLLLALGRFIIRRTVEEDREQLRLIGVILLATILTGVLGLALERLELGSYPKLVSLLFILTGVILVVGSRWKGRVDYASIGVKQGVIAGIAQGLGVLPGISRSGITISAALLSGMTREKAGEFSFLISLPAIAGALLLELRDAEALFSAVAPLQVALGFLAAFVTGLVSLLLLLKLVEGGKLYFFSFYLIPLGFFGMMFL